MEIQLEDRALECKVRAFLWRWAAGAFRYPDAATHAQLADAATWSAAESFARSLGYGPLAAAMARAGEAMAGVSQDSLEVAYATAFGHTVRSPAPPYETEWGFQDSLVQPHWIADAAAFYRAHGLQLAPGAERGDHVSVECEFVHFLLAKEARAAERDQLSNADLCAQNRRRFVEEHIARFVPAFASRLAGSAGDGPYQHFAAVLESLVRAECAASGISCGDEAITQRIPTEDDAACMSCPLHAPAETPT